MLGPEVRAMEGTTSAGEAGLREAERRLAAALGSPDPLAWVEHYTEDAVFDAGEPVVGREALLDMARSMRPLRDVALAPLRTELADGLACVWAEAAWTSGEGEAAVDVSVRGILVWRWDAVAGWRVAMERIG